MQTNTEEGPGVCHEPTGLAEDTIGQGSLVHTQTLSVLGPLSGIYLPQPSGHLPSSEPRFTAQMLQQSPGWEMEAEYKTTCRPGPATARKEPIFFPTLTHLFG